MEPLAAIKGIEATVSGSDITLWSDSEYLVKTMTQGWRRRANTDLWQRLDRLVADRTLRWEWVRGHAGHLWNEEADRLAQAQARAVRNRSGLDRKEVETVMSSEHFTSLANSPALDDVPLVAPTGMVDVSDKPVTAREATAAVTVRLGREAFEALRDGSLPKGDALAMAQAAGILAAKQTPYLLPMCHPLPIEQVTVGFALDPEARAVTVTTLVKTSARTGPEMEALTAAAVAALTIYDMCKGVNPAILVEALRLLSKSGGKSGTVILESPA
jgi:cyclic pyranopterin phosphate synthase